MKAFCKRNTQNKPILAAFYLLIFCKQSKNRRKIAVFCAVFIFASADAYYIKYRKNVYGGV